MSLDTRLPLDPVGPEAASVSSRRSGDRQTGVRQLRDGVRRHAWPLAIGLVILLTVLVAAATAGSGNTKVLDPDGVGADGARAVARVLESHGQALTVVHTPEDLRRVALQGNLSFEIVVSRPDLLDEDDVGAVQSLVATRAAALVLVQPSPRVLVELAPGIHAVDGATRRTVQPQCSDPAATRAGSADAGGDTYVNDGPDPWVECYPVGGHASYLSLSSPRRAVIIGQPELLTNARLDHGGNAALAIGSLSNNLPILWFAPTHSDAAPSDQQSLGSVLPRWVTWVVVQLGLVTLISMLWRGRRFGRLATEPLPVVVRAVETTQGRARMYRRSRAVTRAASTLREASLIRLRQRTGLPRSASPEAVAAVLAGRTGIPSADLTAILGGPPPTDDAGLVRLAQILDRLDNEGLHP